MRLWTSVCIAALAAITTACDEHPVAPDDMRAAVVESSDTLWLEPLDGYPVALEPFAKYTEIDLAGVNRSGQVLGEQSNGGVDVFPTIWDDATPHEIPMPDNTYRVRAVDIADDGTALLWKLEEPDRNSRAVLWDGTTLRDIGDPPGWTSTRPMALSDAGHVVGVAGDFSANEPGTAFVWREGEMTSLPPLAGDTRSEADAVNNHGVVVGRSRSSDGSERFVRWMNGVAEAIGGGDVVRPDWRVLGLSDAEVVLFSNGSRGQSYLWREGQLEPLPFLGISMTPSGIVLGGGSIWKDGERIHLVPPDEDGLTCWWLSDGGYVACQQREGPAYLTRYDFDAPPTSGPPDPNPDPEPEPSGGTYLPPLPGEADSNPSGINALGQIVGTSGGRLVRWEDGVPTEIALPAGMEPVHTAAINDAGQIVVTVGERGAHRAVLWEDGETTDLGVLPGYEQSTSGAIGNAGHIAGTSSGGNATNSRQGWLWHEGRMTPLPWDEGDDASSAGAVNSWGVVAGRSDYTFREATNFAVWTDGRLTWKGGSPFTYGLAGISDAGDVVLAPDAGDIVFVVRDGETRRLTGPTNDALHYATDISPGGRILGVYSSEQLDVDGQWGVWRDDDDFYALEAVGVASCTLVGDGGHVVCSGPASEYPFVTGIGQHVPRLDAVTDLAVTDVSGSTATLAWTQVIDGADGPATYQLRYSMEPMRTWMESSIGCDEEIPGDAVDEEVSCTVEGLQPGTGYDFRVMSFREENGARVDSLFSNVAEAETDPASPMHVSDLVVAGVTRHTLTARWTQVGDGTGEPAKYRLKYADPPLGDWKHGTIGCDPVLVGDEIGAEMSCTIEGLEPATTIDIQLMSFREENGVWVDATYSNIATGTTDETGASGAVDDLEGAGTTSYAATLRWTQVDDGAGSPASYELRYGAPLGHWSEGTVGCDVVGDQVGAESSCTVEGLSPSIEYGFQLASFPAGGGAPGDTLYSNVVTVRTTHPFVGDLAVTGATRRTLTATWTEVGDGTGSPARYRLKYARPPIDWSTATVGCDRTGEQIGAEMSCTIDGLETGETYEVLLMSYRTEDGAWADAVYSNVASGATVTEGPPEPVADLTAISADSSSVGLSWTQIDDGTGTPARYELRYGAPLTAWEEAFVGCHVEGDEIGAEASCLVDGLLQGTPYDFQLVSYRLEDGQRLAELESNVRTVITHGWPRVEDLEVVGTSGSTLTLRWTQVNSGEENPYASHPAWYRVKYAVAPLSDWSSATVGCDPSIEGDRVGTEITCTIEGLNPTTTYDVQLMSYWIEDGVWRDAVYSNVATAATEDAVR